MLFEAGRCPPTAVVSKGPITGPGEVAARVGGMNILASISKGVQVSKVRGSVLSWIEVRRAPMACSPVCLYIS